MSTSLRMADFTTRKGVRIWVEAAESGYIADLRVGNKKTKISREDAELLRDGLDKFLAISPDLRLD